MTPSTPNFLRTGCATPTDYQAFLWLELIAFDNTQPDMGVSAYLDILGFIPTGMSIFMWGPDFVHLHDGLAADAPFPNDIGAYLDCFYTGKKQPGPAWTKFQLKRLVDECHKRKVEVYFSIFPNSLDNRFHHEWISDHPEMEVIPLEDYTPWFPMIHPLKRLADGRFYEEFFVAQATAVARDYGFDGIHLVDGYNHGWYQLCDAEYSDDMVDQFIAHSGIRLPADVPAKCGLVKPELAKRAKWIWQNQRRQWIGFHVERWTTFYRKVCRAFHDQGKKVAANTCWTRDPVESIYRYGIDYRRIAEAGVDRFVVETCGAGGEVLNRVCRARFSVPFFHVIKSTSLLTRAFVPDMNICFNNCTQDITEGWSTLRHSPAFLEREIFSYANLFHYDKSGKPQRAFDGLNVCLAADMESYEWRWLKERWDAAYGLSTDAVGGWTLVTSGKAADRELEHYIQTRGSISHNVLYQLSAKGVPIASTVDIADVGKVSGPLLVINPHLYETADIARIIDHRTAPVAMIGPQPPAGAMASYELWDAGPATPMRLFLFNTEKRWDIALTLASMPEPPADLHGIKEAPSFFDEMYFLPVSEAFYSACADIFAEAARPVLMLDIADFPHGEWAGVQTFRLANGRHRCFVWNDQFQYVDTRLSAERCIDEVRTVSKFRGRPIRTFDDEADTWSFKPETKGRYFIVRIPPKGVGVVDITLAGQAR